MLDVFCWSMRHLTTGIYPGCRHDGAPWEASDKGRKKLAGAAMPAQAILAEIRGDWELYESVFKFPAYNRLSGMCWLCKATTKLTKQNYLTQSTWKLLTSCAGMPALAKNLMHCLGCLVSPLSFAGLIGCTLLT